MLGKSIIVHIYIKTDLSDFNTKRLNKLKQKKTVAISLDFEETVSISWVAFLNTTITWLRSISIRKSKLASSLCENFWLRIFIEYSYVQIRGDSVKTKIPHKILMTNYSLWSYKPWRHIDYLIWRTCDVVCDFRQIHFNYLWWAKGQFMLKMNQTQTLIWAFYILITLNWLKQLTKP